MASQAAQKAHLTHRLAPDYFRIYNNRVRVTFDPAKREKTLTERGLDFADAMTVFEGTTIEVEDTRKNYGERRIVSKLASRRTLGSDMAHVDVHQIKPHEYKELPELTDELLARAVVKKGGRPRSENPRQLISLRLPPEVIERWRATGPGWQTRMAERLAKGPIARAKSAA